MRLHTFAALALFAFGVLGGAGWLRDWWRARRIDRDVEQHPVARQLRTLRERHVDPPPSVREAIAEALVRREVVAECEFFDIEAATLGESRCERD